MVGYLVFLFVWPFKTPGLNKLFSAFCNAWFPITLYEGKQPLPLCCKTNQPKIQDKFPKIWKGGWLDYGLGIAPTRIVASILGMHAYGSPHSSAKLMVGHMPSCHVYPMFSCQITI
jgi:hypothetical protein